MIVPPLQRLLAFTAGNTVQILHLRDGNVRDPVNESTRTKPQASESKAQRCKSRARAGGTVLEMDCIIIEAIWSDSRNFTEEGAYTMFSLDQRGVVTVN